MPSEPTSVSVMGITAFVAVNTSEDYINTSGQLVVVDMATQKFTGSSDPGRQPDSVALSKEGAFLSVAIENERDQDLSDGRTGQMPAGYLVMIIFDDMLADYPSLETVDVTGRAA